MSDDQDLAKKNAFLEVCLTAQEDQNKRLKRGNVRLQNDISKLKMTIAGLRNQLKGAQRGLGR